jgi:hypothetical protein
VTHAYPRRCETFNPKPVARVVDESELQAAWVNLERLWRGLDDQRIAEFRELLRRYLKGEFSQSEWAGVVHSIIDWQGATAR